MAHSSRARLRLLASWILLLGALAGGPTLRRAEAANWRDLTGRMAPDLTFMETANGLPSKTRLSSYRNRSVVLLAFWLRDCVQCKRDMPRVQRAYEELAASGLQVITVVHRFRLDELTAVMRRRGWTFPVARDPDGRMAGAYGGGRRPGFYVIGIDGRVKASNGMPVAVLETELGRWRLRELLGSVPAPLSEARDLVYRGDYGGALRSAEGVGASASASPEVTAAVGRLAEIARRKLQNRVDRAERRHRRGEVDQAVREYRKMVSDFRGTSLETRARVLHDEFVARIGGR